MHHLIALARPVGRCFIAFAIIAFGVQHLVYADFVTRLVPKLPLVVPGHALLASIFGVYLVTSGFALLYPKIARSAALLLAAVLLGSLAFLYLPNLAAHPADMGLWVKAGKALTLSGGAFLIAGSLPPAFHGDFDTFASVTKPLEMLIPFGGYSLAAFFAFCGVLHFFYANLVAGLVPSWIPGPVFWTYFSGAALIAAGLGLSIRPTARTAAALSALMVFLWVLMLHIPRALANLRDSNETTAVFEAIAVTGTALLVAAHPVQAEQSRATRDIDARALTDRDLIPGRSVPMVRSRHLGPPHL